MPAFYCYRIMVSEPAQHSLFDARPKEQKLREVFTDLEANKRDEFDYYGNNILFHYSAINENIFVWQIAKEQTYEKPIVGEDRIENISDVRYPNVFAIFHTVRQLVFIEYKSSVFPDVETVKNKLEIYFSNKLAKHKLEQIRSQCT
ncbi:MAG: hypothetical protein ACRYFZ_01575 [Janthinobacterium lividum]